MFFILSKVLWVLSAPGNLLIILLLASATAGAFGSRAGARFALAAALALVACACLPLGTLLLAALENRFPASPDLPDDPAGIIVLGGAIDAEVSRARGQPAFPDAVQRLTEGVILSRRFPGVPLVYSGGSGSLLGDPPEAEEARRLWIALGVPESRIRLEDRSRNTAENAQFSRDLLAPQPGQRWILVTSAYHMPRSVGLFRAAGFDVVADPVDYRTTGDAGDFRPDWHAARGLKRFDLAVREWTGLIAYRITGRIASLFPGP